ncbi:U3 snoRNP protein [Neofusicoccum ribis]|uniref:U3 snoRNP protein n=1 Tax=Neofusicoccum ribis TaxID=45134 RepID=A0ABR3SCG6_9PEZI
MDLSSLSFFPDEDGLRLVTATNRAIHIWNTKTGTMLHVLNSSSSDIRSLALAPNGTYLTTGSEDFGVHLWFASGESTNAIEAAPVDPLPVEYEVKEMAMSPDG